MRKLLPLLVAAVWASLALAVLPVQSDVCQISIDYPKPVWISRDKITEYGISTGDVILAKADPIDGLITLLVCPPIQTGIIVQNSLDAQDAVLRFAEKYPSILPLHIIGFRFERAQQIDGKWYVSLVQQLHELDVIGARSEIRINQKGEVFLFRSSIKLFAGDIDRNPYISEEQARFILSDYVGVSRLVIRRSKLAIAPILSEKRYIPRLVWWIEARSENPPALWVAWIDAHNGEVIRNINELRTVTGTVTGQYKPEYYTEPSAVGPFPYMFVRVDSDAGYTDAHGNYSEGSGTGSHTFRAELRGYYCIIEDGSYTVSPYTTTFTGSTFNFCWTTDHARESQLNLYYHTNFIHDYVRNFLGFTEMDYQMPARVNDPYITDNAYWDGEGINFGRERYMYDFAMFSDIIYHEYTHGVTDNIFPAGTLPYEGESGAIDEALADYFACSINNDPLEGEGTYPDNPSAYLRNLINSLHYPEDMEEEVHADSRIISAVWWTIRTALGRNYTDSLVHETRFGYPEDFESFLFEMLAADDDDGNITNGTPNATVIYPAYREHGIGPSLVINHTPLNDTEDTVNAYVIRATVSPIIGVDSIYICYLVMGPLPSPWTKVNMEFYSGAWHASIPPKPWGSIIRYYIKVRDNVGISATIPEGAPVAFHSFRVDRDDEAPVVEHLPITHGNRTSWPPKVAATIRDNTGISEAFVEYSINDVPQSNVPMVYEAASGMWKTQFSSSIFTNAEVKYRIHAFDNAMVANETVMPSPSTWISFRVNPDYLENVEWGGYDYRHYAVTPGFTDMWHVETYRKYGGTYSFKCGGAGSSDYDDGVDAALETPSISISSGDTLSFYYWAEIETSTAYAAYDSCWDGGLVQMSTNNGVTWFVITPVGGYPYRIMGNPASPFAPGTPCFSGRRNWTQARFIINYTGTVKFCFRFGSDGHVTYEGWYLDDIKVTNINGVSIFEGHKWLPQKISIGAKPNPFNSSTELDIALPECGHLTVDVLDMQGIRVDRLFDGKVVSGKLRLLWKPEKITSGIYFIKATLGSKAATSKVIMIR